MSQADDAPALEGSRTMSDETVNYETNNPGEQGASSTSADAAWTSTGTAERVGFCQDCGTPLTRETARPVGAGVFCEPCLAARVGNVGPQGYTTAPPGAGVPPLDKPPSPGLAGLLSIIPGVGQMYNGQYAKGVVILLIFSVLNSLGKADHLGIFGLAAFGWWIYQIADAYQTAKARVEGRPLPNPFGLNEVGERMGFGKNWGNAAHTYGPTTPPYSAAPPPPYAATAPPYGAATGPVANGPDWVGYVPPTNFASAPPVPPAAQAAAPWTQAPYTQPYAPTYTAAVYPADPTVPMPVVDIPPAKRFPVGAIWLIGLGVVFLLGEFAPDWGWSWRLSQNWLLAGLFAGISAWTLTRRMNSGDHSICGYRWPVILGVLALLFVFQALDIASIGRTWPVLFIAFGAMLILERTSLGTPEFGHAYPTNIYTPPPTSEAEASERARAAWSTPVTPAATQEAGTETHSTVDDSTKGGF
jgi:TM2 domain-containing membrane protein YozV